jgi:DNA recombination protein RmuC
MDISQPALVLIATLASAVVTALVCRALASAERARALSEAEARHVAEAAERLAAAREEITALRTERATFDARIEEHVRGQAQLREAFQALSTDALRANNEQFLQLARQELERVREATSTEATQKHREIDALLEPIRQGLAGYDAKLAEIEKGRVESFATLVERLDTVARVGDTLRGETAMLARALRSSNTRGTWGEVQLRRVCELAGMIDHCDFRTQQTVGDGESRLRPDLVVNLPGGKTIVVDSKAPATAFLDAVGCEDESRRRELLAQHAAHVKGHVAALSRKSYWEQFEQAPEFVVLFLPNEAFFSAALEHEPSLIELGVEQGVVIATPTTLIALLKAVAYGWRQERIAESAQAVSALGRELYDRLSTIGRHFGEVGRNLERTVKSYNESVGSLEKRVLVTAREFHALGAAGSRPIAELEELTARPRALSADELLNELAPADDRPLLPS